MTPAIPRWNAKRKRWEVKKQLNGERKTFVSSKPDKPGFNECKRKAEAWAMGSQLKRKRLGDVWPKYLENVQVRGGGANYRQKETYGRLYILPALRHKVVSTITDQDWQDVVDGAYKKGANGKPLSKKTLTTLRGVVTDFSTWAKKSRLMEQRPELYVPKRAKTQEHVILTTDQIKTLFADDHWYINAWRLMVVLGLRPGECLGLKKKDVTGDYLVIRRSINNDNEVTPGKNANARRRFFLPPIAKQIIQAQLGRLYASVWLFPDRLMQSPHPNAVYSAWRRWATHKGIQCSMYELRHTHASYLKHWLKMDQKKRGMGHSESMHTEIYEHEYDGELEEIANLINQRWTLLVDTSGKNKDTSPNESATKVLQIRDFA